MKLMLFFICIMGCLNTGAQLSTVSFSQLDSLQKSEKRPVVVFIHTDWCRYCHLMKQTCLKNDQIKSMLTNKFYFLELNAEEKKDVWFHNSRFRFKPTGINTGIHELAGQLATIDKNISYPTICVLNDMYEIIYQQTGFIPPENLLTTLSLLLE